MGKKKGGFGGRKQGKSESEGPRRAPITLREEATGKLQTKESTSVRSMLKVDHLKNLSVWASQEAKIPSLGAFYGHQLAAVAEAAGVPPDPSLITCQRCETVLDPGFNSTVRIEKTRSKVRHRSNKPVNKTQNNVVYKCHFCLHQSVKRGTPKGYAHIKGKLPSKNKSSLESRPPTESITQESSKSEKSIICKAKPNEVDVFASQVVAKDVSLVDGPATPSSVSTTTTTLEGKKRRRNSSKSEKSIICEDKVNEVGVFASQVVAKDASLVDGPATPSSVSTTTATLEGKKRRRNSSKSEKSIICEDKVNEVGVFASQVVAKDVSLVDGPATPSSVSTTTATLEGKKRRRNSSTSKKGAETAGMCAISEASKTLSKASKRRKRSWTSLKELAQSNEHENSPVPNLTIPFLLKVYDTIEKKLWRLTDKDYEDVKQQEIDELVQKTLQRMGELLDIEIEEAPADQEDLTKNKWTKRTSHLDVIWEEEGTPNGDQHLKPETPGNCVNDASEYYRILVNFNALTGNTHRDKWLEKLLEHVHYMCKSDDSAERDDNRLQNVNSDGNNNRCSEPANDCQDKGQKSSKSFIWPDAAVPAIVALEKASHDALSSVQKYNKKLRQLGYNLKTNALLAYRLLNGELEPSKMLNMTPNELKEACTAEEMGKKESDEPQLMQMTDARCQRCNECKVGLRHIIHAGHSDRYQLECVACGNSWYAFRDEVSILTIDAPVSKKNLDTEPRATKKVEDFKKKPVSPSEPEKQSHDDSKTSEA